MRPILWSQIKIKTNILFGKKYYKKNEIKFQEIEKKQIHSFEIQMNIFETIKPRTLLDCLDINNIIKFDQIQILYFLESRETSLLSLIDSETLDIEKLDFNKVNNSLKYFVTKNNSTLLTNKLFLHYARELNYEMMDSLKPFLDINHLNNLLIEPESSLYTCTCEKIKYLDVYANIEDDKINNVVFDLLDKKESIPLLKYFISIGANPNYFFTTFTKLKDFETVKRLVELGGVPDGSAMIEACHCQDFDLIEYFVKTFDMGNDFDVFNHCGSSLTLMKQLTNLGLKPKKIGYLVCKGLEIVKFLVENGAEIDTKAVFEACGRGSLDIVEYFYKKGIKFSDTDITEALEYENYHIVAFLIRENDKNEFTNIIIKALQKHGNLKKLCSIENNNQDQTFIIEYILSALDTSDPSHKNMLGRHLIEWMVYFDHSKLKTLVTQDSYWTLSHVIEYSGMYGKLENLKYLTNLGYNIFEYEYGYGCVFHDASKYGHMEIVKYLANLDTFNSDCIDTAIYMASINGYLEIIKYLVSICNHTLTQNHRGLNVAAENGHLDTVKYFVNLGEKDLDFAFEYAVGNNHLKIVKYLISCGVSVNSFRFIQYTNDLEMTKFLVTQGANLDLIKNPNFKKDMESYKKYKPIMDTCLEQIHGDPILERTKSEQMDMLLNYQQNL